MDFLISKALIDSVISHDEFVLINNVVKEYNETQFKDLVKCRLFTKQFFHIA